MVCGISCLHSDLMMPVPDLSQCSEVVQEVLVPWYTRGVQEYSVLSAKDGKVYRCAKEGQESHLCGFKNEKRFSKTFLD